MPKDTHTIDQLNTDSWNTMVQSPQQGHTLAEQALALAKEHSYEQGRVEATLNRGWCRQFLGDYEGALQDFVASRDGFRALGMPEGQTKALNGIGVVYHNTGQLELAIDYYNSSLELSRRAGLRDRQAAALNNIGEVCVSMGRAEEALNYFNQARVELDSFEEDEMQAHVGINLGQASRKLGRYTEAGTQLNDALLLAQSAGDRIAEARCLTELGLLYQQLDSYDEAEVFHQRSLALSESTGNRLGSIDALQHLGRLHFNAGNTERALEILREVVEQSEAANAKVQAVKSYRRLALIYEERGEFEKALRFYKQYNNIQADIHREDTEKRIRSLKAQFEIDQSQRQAELYRARSEELERTNARIQAIAAIGREISASLDLETVMERLYRNLNRLLDADIFGIAIFEEAARRLDYRLFIENGERLPPYARNVDEADSFGAYCVRTRERIVLNDVEREYGKYIAKRSRTHGASAKSLIYLPLLYQDRVQGILTVQSFETDAYTPSDVDILDALSSYIGIAVENSLTHSEVNRLHAMVLEEKGELEDAYEQIAHMANHDNLTGLPNRRLLLELLADYLPFARRNKRAFAIFYIDLDNFKPVNDSFGHAAGDKVLIEVAGRLQSCLRSSDTIARIGGDEFIAVVRDTDAVDSLEATRARMLEQIAAPLEVDGHDIRLTASIGVSVFPDDGETVDSLLRRGDRAMYELKQNRGSRSDD
jgi:diguanylate cyclase (GGDEF)-like protein